MIMRGGLFSSMARLAWFSSRCLLPDLFMAYMHYETDEAFCVHVGTCMRRS